ncbi:MAG: MBL fold metallo-hydrolase [Euryarchaeota archaeon]|jgi:putative mRNA 3-end processing factor|nr:MBL fold metallo-hydrolase [Euryarchaeota archaeon]MBT4474725.1 MBL fold metallo-hydrolase [Euryarchaeota archaeon]MBT4794448.1 MBL fold metallo-hydrolase [Euryarchaeota archaeon]
MVLYNPGQFTKYPSEPVDNGIRFHFLGGGDEVGNVGCIIEDNTGTRLLIDYGLAPTRPPKYPDQSPSVTDAIITHSHIDHIGMVPWLTRFNNIRFHGTSLTADVSEIMWRDTYKVSKIEGYPLSWDKRDLEYALESWVTHEYGEWFDVGKWKCRLHRAGHMPGACMIEIVTPTHRILWSGDLDTRDSPNTYGAKPIECDILCLEATYGGKNHPDRKEEESRFVASVKKIVKRGGVALVPAFASGRGQDILRILHREAPELNVHYDGMGTRLTRKWFDNPQHIRDPDSLAKVWKWTKKVSSKSDRKKALQADVIVTTSGMLDGGPALWYLNRLRNDQANGILITGYQAENSGGRKLLDEGKISIFGNITQIDLEVSQFQLSNHAGHSELCNFANKCNPQSMILFHAPEESRDVIFSEMSEKINIHLPVNGTPIYINS